MSNSLKITQHTCKSRAGQGGWLWALLLITPPVAPLVQTRLREVAFPPRSIETSLLKVTSVSGSCPFSLPSTNLHQEMQAPSPPPLRCCRQWCICQFYGYAVGFPWQPLEDLNLDFFKSSLQVWPESYIILYPFLCDVIP